MKNKLKRLILTVALALIGGVLMFSCQKMLDVEPDKGLEPNQYYKDKFDADDAVIGIYGQILGLAKQYFLLNELRGDLMDVTYNADQNLIDLSSHNVGPDNPYADPKPFYKVILSCNDVLKNFDIMKSESRMTEAEYNQRYSDIAAIRCWLYLQLVIHYGRVPYITDPLLTVEDLKDISKYPVLSIEEMAAELAGFMENVPYKDEYESNSSLQAVIDGYSPARYFINKKALLGDLYLWSGNYLKAATYYKGIIAVDASVTGAGTLHYDKYKVRYAEVSTNQDLSVGYIRNKESDFYSLIDNYSYGWKSMFTNFNGSTKDWEWIWYLQFSKNFQPQSPFIDLCAKYGGHYLVKPSQAAIDLWNSQTQRNEFPFDQRGKFTYDLQGGDPVIMKYIYTYSPLTPQDKTGKWFLTRAALLHLRFAEASNRDNKPKIAIGMLNNGIASVYGNVRTDLPAPYDFETVPSRGLWHRHNGVRGRASLKPVSFSSSLTPEDSLVSIENALIDEAALELAYEGNRWGDILRIAMRRNDPTYLADKIYVKLQKAGHPEAVQVRNKLMNKENWFLPFKL